MKLEPRCSLMGQCESVWHRKVACTHRILNDHNSSCSIGGGRRSAYPSMVDSVLQIFIEKGKREDVCPTRQPNSLCKQEPTMYACISLGYREMGPHSDPRTVYELPNLPERLKRD